jgi:hypothetical protein
LSGINRKCCSTSTCQTSSSQCNSGEKFDFLSYICQPKVLIRLHFFFQSTHIVAYFDARVRNWESTVRRWWIELVKNLVRRMNGRSDRPRTKDGRSRSDLGVSCREIEDTTTTNNIHDDTWKFLPSYEKNDNNTYIHRHVVVGLASNNTTEWMRDSSSSRYYKLHKCLLGAKLCVQCRRLGCLCSPRLSSGRCHCECSCFVWWRL